MDSTLWTGATRLKSKGTNSSALSSPELAGEPPDASGVAWAPSKPTPRFRCLAAEQDIDTNCGKILVAHTVGRKRMSEIPMESHAADGTRSAGLTPANGFSSPHAQPQQDDDAGRLRGIVALPHKRDIILTDEVELDAEKLPRWQPHIRVDEGRLSNDDHE
jgi:hypothetical protein